MDCLINQLPWSVVTIMYTPNQNIQGVVIACAIVSVEMALIEIASDQRVNWYESGWLIRSANPSLSNRSFK